MKIDIVSDLHGFKPILESGDLLIVCGDWTARDTYQENILFKNWLDEQDYERKIFIAGNHDNLIQNTKILDDVFYEYFDDYLCDSGTEYEWLEKEPTKWGSKHLDGCKKIKLKIWGSPWTTTFPEINPHCTAFTVENDPQLAKKWALIPDDIDILITHSPPYGILDQNTRGKHCGSASLLDALNRVKPKYHFFGHIHEQGGKELLYKHIGPNTWCMNTSYVDERYRPVHPVRSVTIQ